MILKPPFNYITFDRKNLFDWGLHTNGGKTFGTPERDYEDVEIPGRNGALTFDKGRFKNVTLTYSDCSLIFDDEITFEQNISALLNWLAKGYSYRRLEDTYHPDEYRLAKFVGGTDPEVYYLRSASFDLEFDCKPQRYLKIGEQSISFTATGKIYNPTLFPSEPLIRVYGTGTVTVGSVTITISSHSGISYIDIDSEIKDCFYGSTNCNKYVAISSSDTDLDFPVLESEDTTISLGSGITKVEITPRWWKV